MKTPNSIYTRFANKGGGLPILFLHGFLETGQVWLPWLNDLQIPHTAVIPDLPGHGQSQVWDGKSEFSEWASALVSIVDQNFPDISFDIIGHSMGGYLALEIARLFPDRVKKMVLFHSTPMPDIPSQTESRRRQINLVEKGRRQLLIKGVGPGMFAPENRDRLKEIGEGLNQQARSCSSEGMIQTLWTIMNRRDFVPVMERRCSDILWITGGEDPFMPSSHIKNVKRRFPCLKHKHFHDCGHAAFLEKPNETNEVLKEFLENGVFRGI